MELQYVNTVEAVRARQLASVERLMMSAGSVIELHNEDCLLGMDSFPNGYFDVIVTSPPYNLGVNYSQYNDGIPRNQYLDWLKEVAIKIKEKMRDSGSFFLNIGSIPTNPWGPFEIITMLRDHFELQNTIHWIKSIFVENESYGRRQVMNVGHYKPINGKRFLNDSHEYIFHLTKSGNVPLNRLAIGVPYKDSGNILRWKRGANQARCRGNAWYIPYKTIQSRIKQRPHPATFPSEIAEMCIQLHGLNDNLIVLDPFMGIGNTSIAAVKLGLNCVGFEIDREYFEANVKQIESMMVVNRLELAERDSNSFQSPSETT